MEQKTPTLPNEIRDEAARKPKPAGSKSSIRVWSKIVTCMTVVLGSPKAAKETQRFKKEETCKG